MGGVMIFTKRFYGVPAGSIYPKWFEAGEDCPRELQGAAASVGAVEADSAEPPADEPVVVEPVVVEPAVVEEKKTTKK